MNIIKDFFKIKERNSDIKTELLGGFTTFITIVYIIAVIPLNLSGIGLDLGGAFTATVISTTIATLIVGIYGNFPFALVPSIGINSYFAFSIILTMGKSVEFALTASLISAFILLLLTILNIRQMLFNAIPVTLKQAMVCGVGLFIAFVGLKNVGIIEVGDGLLKLGNLQNPSIYLSLIGILLISILEYYNKKGSFLIGILFVTIIGIFLNVTKLPTSIVSMPPSISKTYLRFLSINEILSLDMALSVLVFLFVAIFDTIGTLSGLGAKADLLDKNGKLEKINRVYIADSIGGIVASICGTSIIGTALESASGIKEGAKTGLSSVVVSILFVISLFLSPIFLSIPTAATTPVLFIIGYSMISTIKSIDFSDITEALPAFVVIIMTPLTYSIADGIILGLLSYVLIKIFAGRLREIPKATLVLAFIFILKIILIK